MSDLDLDLILRAAELAVRAGDDRVLERAIRALGVTLAELDPVTAGMLDLDAHLRQRLRDELAAIENVRIEQKTKR